MLSKGPFRKLFPSNKLRGDPVLLFWLRLLRKSRWPWKSASIGDIRKFYSKWRILYGRYMSYLQAAKRILKFEAIWAPQSWCKKNVQAAKMQDPSQKQSNRRASSSCKKGKQLPEKVPYYITDKEEVNTCRMLGCSQRFFCSDLLVWLKGCQGLQRPFQGKVY